MVIIRKPRAQLTIRVETEFAGPKIGFFKIYFILFFSELSRSDAESLRHKNMAPLYFSLTVIFSAHPLQALNGFDIMAFERGIQIKTVLQPV